jgi:hypothetical protein
MPPNDQMVEPAFGDEDMSAWLDSLNEDAKLNLPQLELNPMAHQVSGQEDEPDEESDDDDDSNNDDDSTEDDDEEGTPSTEEDFVTVNGNQIARADIQRLYEFDKYLRANPAAAQRLAAALPEPTGESTVPATGETSPPTNQDYQEPVKPEWLDDDDPQQKFVWESMVSLQKSQFETTRQQQQFLAQQQSFQVEQNQRQAAADMAQAIATFREQYPGLNEDDLASIRKDAVPFVKPMMEQLPPVEALRRSMEVAAYANTDMRQKLEMANPNPTNKQKSQTRKAKLGSLSSSPRSAPKEVTRPSFSSDRDMVNAIAHEISDQMGNQR